MSVENRRSHEIEHDESPRSRAFNLRLCLLRDLRAQNTRRTFRKDENDRSMRVNELNVLLSQTAGRSTIIGLKGPRKDQILIVEAGLFGASVWATSREAH